MYLNTVFKYNVFKYCPALVQGCTVGQITNGENCMGGGDNLLVYDTYHSELFKCARIVASRA